MRTIAISTIFIVVLILISESQAKAADSDTKQGAQKAVLVTGASTGIGRKIAEALAKQGYFVYAGARKRKDLDDLNSIENVKAIRLDVTVQEDINAAVEIVREEGRGLYGIVNNAGVAIAAPLIEVEEDELDFIFDVNIYGPYRISKAFSSFVIDSKGRIVNISSISGVLSGFLFGPYSMSKHAIEAYTDSLARELSRFDVQVIAVEPGNYKSRIGQSLVERMQARGYGGEGSIFEADIKRMISYIEGNGLSAGDEPEPDQVAKEVIHALFADHPKEHYMVVPEQDQAEITIRKAIEELVRYNEGHLFSYDRDELISMLDDALADSAEKLSE